MKKKIISILRSATTPAAAFLFAAFLFYSCDKNEMQDLQPVKGPAGTESAIANAGSDAGSNTVTDFSPTAVIPMDEMISITHGTCMGTCPYYRVDVSRSGEVIYTGFRNVRVVGSVRFMVSANVAYELGYMMVANGFFNFQDQYLIIPDGQRFETTLIWNSKIKTVLDYGVHVPQALLMMRQEVEKRLDIQRFLDGSTADADVLNNK